MSIVAILLIILFIVVIKKVSDYKKKKATESSSDINVINGKPLSNKSWGVTFALCLFLGVTGAHRFYTGKIGTGILYLVTGGFYGIGALIDLICIIAGVFKDKSGAKIKYKRSNYVKDYSVDNNDRTDLSYTHQDDDRPKKTCVLCGRIIREDDSNRIANTDFYYCQMHTYFLNNIRDIVLSEKCEDDDMCYASLTDLVNIYSDKLKNNSNDFKTAVSNLIVEEARKYGRVLDVKILSAVIDGKPLSNVEVNFTPEEKTEGSKDLKETEDTKSSANVDNEAEDPENIGAIKIPSVYQNIKGDKRMYTIKSRDRRITEYVEKQAYVWLYNHIIRNEFTAVGADAGNLLIAIKRDRCVSKEQYLLFVSLLANSPYEYLIFSGGKTKKSCIYTNKIENYFIKFNGKIIPLGFVKDFFEDDYEIQKEVEELLDAYSKDDMESFILDCQSKKIDKEAEVDSILENHGYLKKNSFMFNLLSIFRVIVPIVSLVLIFMWCGEHKIISTIVYCIKSTDMTFIEINIIPILLNLALIILLIKPIINAIVLIKYYLSVGSVKNYVNNTKKSLNLFDDEAVVNLREMLTEAMIAIKTNKYVISEEHGSSFSKERKRLSAILYFDSNQVLSFINKKMRKKVYDSNGLLYNNDDQYKRCIGIQARKFIWTLVLLIVIMCSDVTLISNLLSKVLG